MFIFFPFSSICSLCGSFLLSLFSLVSCFRDLTCLLTYLASFIKLFSRSFAFLLFTYSLVLSSLWFVFLYSFSYSLIYVVLFFICLFFCFLFFILFFLYLLTLSHLCGSFFSLFILVLSSVLLFFSSLFILFFSFMWFLFPPVYYLVLHSVLFLFSSIYSLAFSSLRFLFLSVIFSDRLSSFSFASVVLLSHE